MIVNNNSIFGPRKTKYTRWTYYTRYRRHTMPFNTSVTIRNINQKGAWICTWLFARTTNLFLIDAQRDHRGFVGALNKWRALHKRFYCTHFTIVHTLSINYIHDYKQKILKEIWKKISGETIKARPLRDLKKSSKGFGKINYLTKH